MYWLPPRLHENVHGEEEIEETGNPGKGIGVQSGGVLTTAMERIKEIDSFANSDRSDPPRRWFNENLQGEPGLMFKDIEFLLRSFKVMREMAHDELQAGNSERERFNKEFEKRMSVSTNPDW